MNDKQAYIAGVDINAGPGKFAKLALEIEISPNDKIIYKQASRPEDVVPIYRAIEAAIDKYNHSSGKRKDTDEKAGVDNMEVRHAPEEVYNICRTTLSVRIKPENVELFKAAVMKFCEDFNAGVIAEGGRGK